MSFVYILYSEKCDRYYVGFCADLQVRLSKTQCRVRNRDSQLQTVRAQSIQTFSIRTRSTKGRVLNKRQKSRKYLEWLIAGTGRHAPINIGVDSNAGNGSTPFRGTLLKATSVAFVVLWRCFIEGQNHSRTLFSN